MSKVKSIVAAALTLAAVSTAASAAIIPDFVVTATAPVSIGNNLSRVTVSFTFTNASKTGFSSGSTFTAPTGTGFNFVSVYDDEGNGTKASGPSTATADYFDFGSQDQAYKDAASTVLISPSDGAADTHFLIDVGQPGLDGANGITQAQQTAFVQGGSWTKKLTGAAPLFTTLGYGGTGGAVALTSPALTQNIAQLVFPSSDTAPISYSFVDLDNNVISGSIPTSVAGTPEPASLGLLGLGAAALIGRRKAKVSK